MGTLYNITTWFGDNADAIHGSVYAKKTGGKINGFFLSSMDDVPEEMKDSVRQTKDGAFVVDSTEFENGERIEPGSFVKYEKVDGMHGYNLWSVDEDVAKTITKQGDEFFQEDGSPMRMFPARSSELPPWAELMSPRYDRDGFVFSSLNGSQRTDKNGYIMETGYGLDSSTPSFQTYTLCLPNGEKICDDDGRPVTLEEFNCMYSEAAKKDAGLSAGKFYETTAVNYYGKAHFGASGVTFQDLVQDTLSGVTKDATIPSVSSNAAIQSALVEGMLPEQSGLSGDRQYS